MAKITVNEKVKAIPEPKKQQIRDLISAGKSIMDISKRLKLEYPVVQTFLWQEGTLPWQGAKKIITLRLQRLRNATKQEARERLAEDIKEQVDYLYYAAKQLSSQLQKVKRALRQLS
jgi:hypothetical protein